jgi:hypothetical protein
LICATPGVMAQQTATPNQSWDVLRQLRAGQKLKVERKTEKKGLRGVCQHVRHGAGRALAGSGNRTLIYSAP